MELVWAMTIHRCQGLTLKSAQVSLKGVFACGHTYVALSRVPLFGNLFLTEPFSLASVRVDPLVQEFYEQKDMPNPKQTRLLQSHSRCLRGKTFIITGQFATLSREQFRGLLECNGARVVVTLAKRSLTDALVGQKAGKQKLLYFNKNSIQQWTEETLIAFVLNEN